MNEIKEMIEQGKQIISERRAYAQQQEEEGKRLAEEKRLGQCSALIDCIMDTIPQVLHKLIKWVPLRDKFETNTRTACPEIVLPSGGMIVMLFVRRNNEPWENAAFHSLNHQSQKLFFKIPKPIVGFDDETDQYKVYFDTRNACCEYAEELPVALAMADEQTAQWNERVKEGDAKNKAYSLAKKNEEMAKPSFNVTPQEKSFIHSLRALLAEIASEAAP